MRWRLFVLFWIFAGPASAEIGEIDVRSGPPASAPETAHETGGVMWIQVKTRVTVLITDSKGRQTGFNPKTNQTVHQIPSSDCSTDFVANQYTGEPHWEAYQRFTFQPAISGAYTIEARGLQDGPFQIDISALANNGSSEPSKQIEGLISASDSKTFRLRYDATPQAQLSVIEQNPKP